MGFVPVLEESWLAREDDEEFGRQTVADLEANQAEPEHVAAVKNDVGARRFRPEEVVAAVICPSSEWPVDFTAAAALAEEILSDLQAARIP